MAQKNRDIFLFFEENADEEVIHNKMVRLYMNRLIIEEEQRFEISNVSKLTRVPKVITTTESDFNRQREKFMEKCSKDKQIILNAFIQSHLFGKFNTEIHIIIGSAFYGGSPFYGGYD